MMKFVVLLVVLATAVLSFDVQILTCPTYYAKGTASASKHACHCQVTLCPQEILTIDGCGRCSGTQAVRLYDSSGNVVVAASGESSACSPCVHVPSFQPNITACAKFTLNEGCQGSGKCQGQISMSVANTTLNRKLSNSYASNAAHADADVESDDLAQYPAFKRGYCASVQHHKYFTDRKIEVICIFGFPFFLIILAIVCGCIRECWRRSKPRGAYDTVSGREVELSVVPSETTSSPIQTPSTTVSAV